MEKIAILERCIERADNVWWKLQAKYPMLKRHKTPDILLNGRLWRTAGLAWQEDKALELGLKFFMFSPETRKTMYNVILPHELCHIADFLVYGPSELECGHGVRWAEMMHALGLPADKFHQMNIAPAKTVL